MLHRDTFETPTIEQIVGDASQRNDRRVLRLFGINECLPPTAAGGTAAVDRG